MTRFYEAMWQLKFKYSHKDCFYSKQIKKLSLVMYAYPFSSILEADKLYLNGIQIIYGADKQIKKYIHYLKINKTKRIDLISNNAFFYETVLTSNIAYYQQIYNPQIFYLSPIIHQNGEEIFEIASWKRELLEKIIQTVKQNKDTLTFQLLSLRKISIKSVFIPQILPKLTEKQIRVLRLAKERGFWKYPKSIKLNQLSKELKISKSTTHEILKRGESKLLDYFI